MKVYIVLSVLVTLALVNSGSSASCNNPLFNSCSGNFFCSVTYLNTPISKPDTRICSDIAVNSQSCCDQTVYNDITAAWIIGRKTIQDSIDQFNQGRQYIDEIVNNFDSYVDQIVTQYPNLTPAQQDQLRTLFYNLRDSIVSVFSSTLSNWARCAGGLLNYWAGLICFGCNPNWDAFLFLSNSSRYTLLLNTDTCTNVVDQCLPLFKGLSDYLTAVTNTFVQIATLTSNNRSTVALDGLAGFKDLCGGDCSSFICNKWLAGLNFVNPFGSSKRSNEETNLEVALMNSVNTMLKAISTATLANAKMERSMAERTSSGFDVGYTSSGGLNAYQNGKSSSGLDTYVAGGAASVWSWVQWLL